MQVKFLFCEISVVTQPLALRARQSNAKKRMLSVGMHSAKKKQKITLDQLNDSLNN